MKKYSKPLILLVKLPEHLAATDICGLTGTIKTSKGVDNSYKFCYHYKDKNGNYSADRARKVQIAPGHKVEIINEGSAEWWEGYNSWKTWTETGWTEASGSNGNCHYIGEVYVDDQLLTANNFPKGVTSW